FFWVDEVVFPTAVEWRASAPKDEMPAAGSYRAENVAVLNTRRTPIQKQPELLFCLVGLSRNYLLGDDEYPIFRYDDGQEMDLFNLISAPNPSKVKTGSRPRAAHELPLLTFTVNRVIEMVDLYAASGSSRTSLTVERSLLDFVNENPAPTATRGSRAEEPTQDELAHEEPPAATTGVAQGLVVEETVAMEKPQGSKRRKQLPRKRASKGAEVNAPSKVLRKDHGSGPTQSTTGGISLAAMGQKAGFTMDAPASQETPADTIDPNPLSFAKPASVPEQDSSQSSKGATAAKDLESETSSPPAAQVSGEEKIKASLEEFKKLEDEKVECRWAEMDARLDTLSIDFDEELYPHMLTAITGCRWVIGHGLRLAVMKCAESTELRQRFADVVSTGIAKGMSEGLKHGVDHGKTQLDLDVLEAYDPKANTKFTTTLQALKDLEYPLVDQLERLKDAPIDLIMASFYLDKVRDPKDPWAEKEEMLLEDVIAANVSHSWSWFCAPCQDAAVQTELLEDESSPRLVRSKSLPSMYNLDWPTCSVLRAPWESLCIPNVLGKQVEDVESVAAGVATLLCGKQFVRYLSYKCPDIVTV
ncbi:hypothetical protein Tco_0711364, partial [Tanacetum coccineum]